jgi:hypothetical protein
MGFVVRQPIQSEFKGNFDEFYVRIETCNISKPIGRLLTGLTAYPNSGSSKLSHITYTDEYSQHITPDVIPVSITYSGSVINYPTYFEFELTSSVLVDVPVYEYTVVSQSINYYDFDESGNVVEKVRWEYTSQSNQIGTEQITKYKYDTNIITGSVHQFAYPLVKYEYGKIFGHQNIIDSI